MAYAAQLQRKAPTFHEMISQQMHQHHEQNNVNGSSNRLDIAGAASPESSRAEESTEGKTRVWVS
jgi:hypothetical protein